jgi:M6 family metalloprotease-like protein
MNYQDRISEKGSNWLWHLVRGRALLLMVAVLAAGTSTHASPFRNLQVPFTQPDGTRTKVIGSGDEFYAVFETADGFTVLFDEALKAYCFAQLAADGTLVSTGQQVHLADGAALGLVPHLRMSKEARGQEISERRQRWEAGMQTGKRWEQLKAFRHAQDAGTNTNTGPQPATSGLSTVGLKIGLTLLIDFDNDPATVPQAEIVNFCNGDNYTGFGNNGSVKKYFLDNSNGALTYSNVVTVYIRMPNSLHPKSWYDDTSQDCGSQGNLLVRDALTILKALPDYTTEILPTFQSLNVDATNQVLAVNVFFAGYNSGVWAKGLWPHSWDLEEVGAQELSPGGKTVYWYQITDIGDGLTLGTFCHENGHMLCGYPDIYDYDSDSEGGAGMFCLMNSGGHGNNPVQICAYLKRASGWSATTELDSSSSLTATVNAAAGPNFNHFYRYQKPGVPTEYFLVECRDASGRDANLPASGIAIWHIDELGDHSDQRMVPNTSHQNYEVTLVQADNQWDFELNHNNGDWHDLYYSGNSAQGYPNEFSDTSALHAHWWDGSASGLSLHNFTAQAPTMSFQVGYGNVPPQIVAQPQNRTVTANNAVTFTINAAGAPVLTYQWFLNTTPINGATANSYTIQNATPADQGNYWVRVSNGFGSTDSLPALLTVVDGVSLASALDTTGLTWNTGGQAPWESDLATTHDGTDAAQSMTISDNQESWLEMRIINGPGQLSFWWKVSSELVWDSLEFSIDGVVQSFGISGEVDWQQMNYFIPAGNHLVRWRYSKDVAVRAGQDRGWVDQVSFVPDSPAMALGDALDASDLSWTTGGASLWSGQTAVTHDGVDAGRSGMISHYEDSWMQTTVTGGPGTLTFWWSVSSEPDYDYLEFYLDGILQNDRISGEVNWNQQTFDIAAGAHSLRWRYVKDVGVSSGQDRGWVDQVSFVPVAVQPPTLMSPTYLAGGSFRFEVIGSPGATYIVQGSTDLQTWIPLFTNTTPFKFTDPLAAQFPSRVYRAHSGH